MPQATVSLDNAPAANAAVLTIRNVRARAVVAPMKAPVRTASGTIPSAPLVLIDVETNEGIVGRAYIFAYTEAALKPLATFIEQFAPELHGKRIVPFERMREFERRFRLLGWQGLVGMAINGLDMAFWDALGRAASLPVVRLLGGEPLALPAYDSYGLVDPAADEARIAQAVSDGFRAIKIKLGGGDLQKDVATVRAVRGIIGESVALMVDYNQSLDPAEACRRIERLSEFDLAWVEEPVAADDLHGHARVRASSKLPIQTGENWWFPRNMANAIAAGASDLVMIDLMKIGGITGWIAAAGQAQAASLPLSSHLFVEASAHTLAAAPTAHWLEYLDLAGSILKAPLLPRGGTFTAAGPGLGIDWDEKAVTKFSA
jgi:mandelate racemase